MLSIFLNFVLYFQKKYKYVSKKSFLYSLIIVVLYGIFDEIHQIFIPGRYFDIFDLVADVLGCLAGILFVQQIIKINKGT